MRHLIAKGNALVLLLVLASPILAQHRVDPRNNYARVLAVVPLIGSGKTDAAPRRPQYAPSPSTARTRGNILAYSYVASDDGQYALVEFVALDRSAFQPLFNDKNITVFEKGKSNKDDVEKAMQKYKKDFSLDKFPSVVMP